MTFHSSIYIGWVTHQRLRPRRHGLRYDCYWLMLDLDELPQLSDRLRCLSHNRFNLLSFHDADFGTGEGPLRSRVEKLLQDGGIALHGCPIHLMCMPRVLGYQFNPLSVYFCYGQDRALAAVIYEVHNTFHERHSYLIEVRANDDLVVRQRCAKQFYVSPFMDMDMTYDFRLTRPGEKLGIAIRGSDNGDPIIHTALAAKRHALTDWGLLRVFVSLPLVTLKVIGAIHWEALRLWGKKLRLRPRPEPPKSPVTIPPQYHQSEDRHA